VWNFNDGTDTVQNCGPVQHTFENAGVYTVSFSAENSIGCFGNETKVAYITVIENPVASFTSTPNVVDILDTEVQFVNSSTNAVTYNWTFGDGNTSTLQNPINVYPEIGERGYVVQLIAINSIGCADTANAVVFINDIVIFYIPNTFTPDGDEFNNTFRPVLNSGIDLFSYNLILYNRWGEIIFETSDPLVGWDGTYHNKLVQEGTYTWALEFKESMSDKRHNYNGKVTMIR
jgi:gliding motility-associated-like protein